MRIIQTNTPIEAWKLALRYITKKGIDFEDENSRICREILNLSIKIDKPDENNVAKPIERLNEFPFWKYPPLDEIRRIMLSTKLAPDYAYSYGPRIFNFQNKVNQMNDFVIPLLKDIRTTRRATISIVDPVKDANTVTPDTPGLIAVDFKVRDNKLHTTSIIRSNDVFFGWPANIYQIYVLHDYVKKKIESDSGSISTFSISAHVFRDQLMFINEIIGK